MNRKKTNLIKNSKIVTGSARTIFTIKGKEILKARTAESR